MQGMEPTQGNAGNIGGGDSHIECMKCRYTEVGIASLVEKGHHIRNGTNAGKHRECLECRLPAQGIGPIQ